MHVSGGGRGESEWNHTLLFTIGHSTRGLEEFLALLAASGVGRLADVRRFPGSRRHPHFAREALAVALATRGIAYRHFPGLGGRRRARRDSPHLAWEVEGFRGYADHMEGAEFGASLAELEAWAAEEPAAAVCVMCAEAHPSQCHRRLLADALVRDGFRVVHILAPGRSAEHALTPFARREGPRIVYDGGTLPLEPGPLDPR
jgi:uncharacterized protein (DUF488 family)